ncbi:hypothetical protein, partial [Stenotrophomonas maltophilia]|uniref:hypothetical protein n=1 Tax=Stenotrophomonas maltophilia TaxID=40324 RepID=UPI00313E5DDB
FGFVYRGLPRGLVQGTYAAFLRGLGLLLKVVGGFILGFFFFVLGFVLTHHVPLVFVFLVAVFFVVLPGVN